MICDVDKRSLVTKKSVGAGQPEATVRLSIVIPFYRYDVTPLLEDLIKKAEDRESAVEIVALDDCSPTEVFFADACKVLDLHPDIRITIARSKVNLGRSGARNLLAELACGEFLVYLDCDMLPDLDDYLNRYLEKIESGVEFCYGGRSVTRLQNVEEKYRLHWFFTKCFEQVPAEQRTSAPAFYFLSSNFMISRRLVVEYPLDTRFSGWGWEDCEWAHRIMRSAPLLHMDNPATHLGLISVPEIKKKYLESIKNFDLVLRLCPELVVDSRLYRVVRLLKLFRIGGIVLKLAEIVLDSPAWSLRARVRALQMYKAALYARSGVSTP